MKLILSNKNNLEIFGKRLYRMDFLYSFFVYKEIKFIFFKLFTDIFDNFIGDKRLIGFKILIHQLKIFCFEKFK